MLNTVFYKSPIGILKITSTDYRIQNIELVENMEDFDCSNFNYRVMENLDEYFEGKLRTFNIPLEFPQGTTFEKRVYDKLQHIRYGKTVSYKELAEMLGNPKAYRAVAAACAKNPLPLIIPCHRVICVNGKTGDYNLGGTKNKQYLLDMEKKFS